MLDKLTGFKHTADDPCIQVQFGIQAIGIQFLLTFKDR